MKPFFSSKSQTFGLGQVIWAGKFWGISGVFVRFISSHFGTSFIVWVHVFHWSTIISTKNSAFIFKSQIFRLVDLNLGRKELGIQPLCVRSPCVKIIKENNELSSCRPWFSDFLVVYYAGPCATLLNFLEYSFDNVTCTGYLFLLWFNRNWLRIQSCIFVALKFRYSEKATQIWAIFHFIFDIT